MQSNQVNKVNTKTMLTDQLDHRTPGTSTAYTQHLNSRDKKMEVDRNGVASFLPLFPTPGPAGRIRGSEGRQTPAPEAEASGSPRAARPAVLLEAPAASPLRCWALPESQRSEPPGQHQPSGNSHRLTGLRRPGPLPAVGLREAPEAATG